MTAVVNTNKTQADLVSLQEKLISYDPTKPLEWDKARPNVVTLTLKDGEKLTYHFPKDVNLNESIIPGRIPSKLEEIQAFTEKCTAPVLGVQPKTLANALRIYFENNQALEKSQIPKAVAIIEQPEVSPVPLSTAILPSPKTDNIPDTSSTTKTDEIIERFKEKWGAPEDVVEQKAGKGFFSKIKSFVQSAKTSVVNAFKKSEATIVTSDGEAPVSTVGLAPAKPEVISVEIDQVTPRDAKPLATQSKQIGTVPVPVADLNTLLKGLAGVKLRGTSQETISKVAVALGINPVELNRKQGNILVTPEVVALNKFRIETKATNSNTLRNKADEIFGTPILDWKGLEAERLKNVNSTIVETVTAKPVKKESLVVTNNSKGVLASRSENHEAQPATSILSTATNKVVGLYLVASQKLEKGLDYLLPKSQPSYALESADNSFVAKRTWLSAGAAALVGAYALLPFVSVSNNSQAKSEGDSLGLDSKPQTTLKVETNNPTQFNLNDNITLRRSPEIIVADPSLYEATFPRGLAKLGEDVYRLMAEATEQMTSSPNQGIEMPLASVPVELAPLQTETSTNPSPSTTQVVETGNDLKTNDTVTVVAEAPAPEVAKVTVSIKDFIKIAYYAELGNNLRSNGRKEFQQASLFAVEQFGAEFDLNKLISRLKTDPTSTVLIDPEWKAFLDAVLSGAPKKSAENKAQAAIVLEQIANRTTTEAQPEVVTPQAVQPQVGSAGQIVPEATTTSEKQVDNLLDQTPNVLEEVKANDLRLLILRLANCNRVVADLSPAYYLANQIGITNQEFQWVLDNKDVQVQVSSGIYSLITEMNAGLINTVGLRNAFANLDTQKDDSQVSWASVDRLARNVGLELVSDGITRRRTHSRAFVRNDNGAFEMNINITDPSPLGRLFGAREKENYSFSFIANDGETYSASMLRRAGETDPSKWKIKGDELAREGLINTILSSGNLSFR